MILTHLSSHESQHKYHQTGQHKGKVPTADITQADSGLRAQVKFAMCGSLCAGWTDTH